MFEETRKTEQPMLEKVERECCKPVDRSGQMVVHSTSPSTKFCLPTWHVAHHKTCLLSLSSSTTLLLLMLLCTCGPPLTPLILQNRISSTLLLPPLLYSTHDVLSALPYTSPLLWRRVVPSRHSLSALSCRGMDLPPFFSKGSWCLFISFSFSLSLPCPSLSPSPSPALCTMQHTQHKQGWGSNGHQVSIFPDVESNQNTLLQLFHHMNPRRQKELCSAVRHSTLQYISLPAAGTAGRVVLGCA